MSDEAHLPTFEPGACAPPRLPLADGHPGRSQRDPSASCAGPQEAVRLTILTRRADFLAANRGKRAPMPGFVLLIRDRGDGDPLMRMGITVTKKIGNAVVRNRMKRRFRALFHELLPQTGVAGADHILIGREGGIERPFEALRIELRKALAKVRR
jgi:ribonuclease P protein component